MLNTGTTRIRREHMCDVDYLASCPQFDRIETPEVSKRCSNLHTTAHQGRPQAVEERAMPDIPIVAMRTIEVKVEADEVRKGTRCANLGSDLTNLQSRLICGSYGSAPH